MANTKEQKMINVPYFHLLWLYDNNKCGTMIREYIKDNMDALLMEKKNNEQ
jgi:hypothetical protein